MNDAERVQKAIAWYQANRQRIAAALPLVCPPAEYRTGWQARFDGYWIPAAQSGQLSNTLAMAYIVVPLRKIRGLIGDETID